MTVPLNELVASLPLELEKDATAQEALRDLLGKLAERPVPVGLLTRLWSMGTLQAKIALAYFAYWVRSGFRSDDENGRRLNETHLTAALKLLEGMSYLRGIVMKMGQTLAAYPKIAPREFAETLARLQFEAPPMHFSLLREQVRNELGGEPEDVFAEFEPRAFAAASLGQVHRARLHSGEAVAVKIQYPNIARTIRNDVRALIGLLTPMRLTQDWENIRRNMTDVREMVELETDYVREAEFLRRARVAFGPDEGIVVPRVFDEFSTGRVLTMEFIEGVHLDRYLACSPSQGERDRYGMLMMRASFRVAHRAKLWYADAHPGNFFFMPDGRLGMIDFGCCREFSEEEWAYYKEVGQVHRRGGDEFQRVMIRAAGLDPDQPQDEQHVRLLVDLGHWYNDYLLFEGPFDFGNEEFMQRGIDLMTEVARRRYFLTLPVNTWISRELLGLRAIAYRLGARIDMKRLNEEESKGVFFD